MAVDEVEAPQIVYIALGTNIEPKEERLRAAVRALRDLGEVTAVSRVYETDPVGYEPQPQFLNAAVRLETLFGPLELLRALRNLERSLGRKDRPRWHEREIDFDILFYGDMVLQSPDLVIPHPEIQNRAFVLAPTADLDPNFVHPVLHRSVAELLEATDTSGIRTIDTSLG